MAHKKAGVVHVMVATPIQTISVKKFGGEFVRAGNIIIRQRGTKYHPGSNVGCGRDYTLFALTDGFVSFIKKGASMRHYVNVQPIEANENSETA